MVSTNLRRPAMRRGFNLSNLRRGAVLNQERPSKLNNKALKITEKRGLNWRNMYSNKGSANQVRRPMRRHTHDAVRLASFVNSLVTVSQSSGRDGQKSER